MGQREDLVVAAVKAWTAQLVDMGGRNTLLYYKDLKLGTLDLGEADPAQVAELLGGKLVRLSKLFAAGEPLVAAAKRARTIRAKAQENFDERGLLTLYLAHGIATWRTDRSAATPAAPVLLCEARLYPRGGAQEDFEIGLPGDWEINPTLLHLLASEFNAGIDESALDEMLTSGDGSPQAVFDALASQASETPGFAIAPRTVLGNFSYAKLPMVRDLEAGSADGTLAAHDLVAAIAGDEDARAQVRGRLPEPVPELPDVISPQNEFLVLDADSSQSSVIAAVTAGGDLVVEGPPGTGKSQTIANLIATLAADGKRVLFVAEKRAAIDAVLKRLDRRGLGNLVLDLHEGAGSRKRLAEDLSRALHDAARLPLPDFADTQRDLVKRRETLRAHAAALHAKREPWGISVYDVQARLLALGASRSEVRVRGDALAALSAGEIEAAKDDLRALADLGGLSVEASGSPWLGAHRAGSVTTPADAEAALTEASKLATSTLPQALAVFARTVSQAGLATQQTVAGWTATVALMAGVGATLSRFNVAVFAEPLDEHAMELAPAARGAFARMRASLFDGGYRRSRKAMRRQVRDGVKVKTKDLYEAASTAGEQRRAWSTRAAGGGAGLPRAPESLAEAIHHADVLAREIAALESRLGGQDVEDLSVEQLRAFLQSLLDDRPTLYRLPELARLRRALGLRGLDAVIAEAASRGVDANGAAALLDAVWLGSILDAISIADPAIGAFDADALSRAAQEYAELDRKHIDSGAVRVLRAVAERATKVRDAHPQESDVIEHQARLKRRHMAVRDLFAAAPNVLGALKPCWAMSPLVVAQLLPQQRVFDVVIFDEASQVMPADAVSALVRSGNAVVAGDTRQLPPTSFFMAGTQDDEDAVETALTTGLESILHVMGALLPAPKGSRTLEWHYRSRDERLIAFSNLQPSLYGGSLTTFPGVGAGAIGHVLVAGDADAEAARVVGLMLEHARTRPDETLGVIAMGIEHAQRIAEALRVARAKASDLDAFFDRADEPVFVKNLERVQGDERDAILLSVGYPKGSYRFGPVNMDGGERRLNVAITRARKRMTVVSSFTSGDMDPSKLRSEGAQMLRRYLRYAESGGADLGDGHASPPPLDGFLGDVRAELEGSGVGVEPMHGASRQRIDFAARHPSRDGRLVAAIETDGPAWAATPTVRDRERLRREHLERLGWRYLRVWSSGWFRNAPVTTARIVQEWRLAAAIADAEAERAVVADPPVAPTTSPLPKRGSRPRFTPGRPIDQYSRGLLIDVVRWIESDTLLRTEEDLLLEAMEVLGFKRKGPKIVGALTDAIRAARER